VNDFALPTELFGDPCPIPAMGSGGQCSMQVGVYVYTDKGDRLPMCEAHYLYTEWLTKDENGRLQAYEPRVVRPSDPH
jgi:hypothetical protein